MKDWRTLHQYNNILTNTTKEETYSFLPSCQMFVVGKDLVTQLVHKLIKTKVHLQNINFLI